MTLARGVAALALLPAVAAALVTGGVRAQPSVPKPGGTFHAVFTADPPTLDPAQATDLTSSAVIRQIFDTLVELDERLQPAATGLAQHWTVARDGKTYTFVLRPHVRFHNGRVLTAADVKYSFERAAKGKRPWVFDKLLGGRDFVKGAAAEIKGVRVVDDATVELRLEAPFAPFLFLMAYDAASIVPREEAERAGFASRPVGTGAFRFGSWRRDDQVTLERFADHFRGHAYLDRVVFRVIPAEATRFNEYVAGQLEYTDIPTGRCRALQSDLRLKGEVAIWPTLGTHGLRFDVERPPFGDVRVRQAIAHAVDPGIIVDRLLEGCVQPARGILPPAVPGYSPDVRRLAFDRARARTLLAEAGFPGGRGLPPIAFHFNTSDANRRIAEVLQAQLKEIGMTLELRALDWAAHIKLVDEGSAGFFRQGWVADYPDPENFLTVLFHSRNVGAAGNTSRYRNPHVDRLFDDADAMPSGPARWRKYHEAEQAIIDDAVWISLYHYASRSLIKPYVRGLERSAQSTAPELLAPLRKVWLDR